MYPVLLPVAPVCPAACFLCVSALRKHIVLLSFLSGSWKCPLGYFCLKRTEHSQSSYFLLYKQQVLCGSGFQTEAQIGLHWKGPSSSNSPAIGKEAFH